MEGRKEHLDTNLRVEAGGDQLLSPPDAVYNGQAVRQGNRDLQLPYFESSDAPESSQSSQWRSSFGSSPPNMMIRTPNMVPEMPNGGIRQSSPCFPSSPPFQLANRITDNPSPVPAPSPVLAGNSGPEIIFDSPISPLTTTVAGRMSDSGPESFLNNPVTTEQSYRGPGSFRQNPMITELTDCGYVSVLQAHLNPPRASNTISLRQRVCDARAENFRKGRFYTGGLQREIERRLRRNQRLAAVKKSDGRAEDELISALDCPKSDCRMRFKRKEDFLMHLSGPHASPSVYQRRLVDKSRKEPCQSMHE